VKLANHIRSEILGMGTLQRNGDMESRLFLAIKELDTNTVHGILSNGMNPNVLDSDGFSPLYYAAIKESMSICQLLVKHGADVNLKDSKLRTPIFGAVFSGNLELTRYFVENHAILDLIDTTGLNLLHIAARKGHHFMLHYLIHKNVKIIQDSTNKTLLHEATIHDNMMCVKYLVEKCKMPLDSVDDKNRTAIHYACRENHFNVAKYLAYKGARLDLVDDDHSNPIQLAQQNDHHYLASVLSSSAFPPLDILESQIEIMRRSSHQRNIFLSIYFGLTYFFLSTAYVGFWVELLQFFILLVVLYRCGFVLQSSTTRNIHYVAWVCGSLWIIPVFAYQILLRETRTVWFFMDLTILILTSIGIFFYFKTLLADPGVLPQNTDESIIYRLVEEGKFSKNIYCSTCLRAKPLRSKHNTETNRCFGKFDHMCIWLNTPIGSKNANAFFYFLICLVPGLIGQFILSSIFLYNVGAPLFYKCFVMYPQITWTLLIYNILLILFSGSMLKTFLGNTMMNLTSNEVFYPERYPWIFVDEKDDSIKSSFDKGVQENMVEFLRNDIDWDNVYKCKPTSVAVTWLQERGMIVPEEITTSSEKKLNF
jgi:hypothetical protein